MSDNLKTWPDRIWLQHSEDGYPVPAYKVETDEITWCEDKQHDCDIEYVRADRIAELERQLAELRSQPTAQQVEDARRYQYLRRKFCLTGNGDGTCAMQAINLPGAISGWPEPSQVAEFCDVAIDAAMQAGKGPE